MTGRTQSVADRQSEQSVIGQSGNWEELLLDSALTSGCDGECGGMHPCELSRAALLRASPVLLLPLLTRIHEDQHRSVVCTYAAVVFDSGADAARRAAALVPGYGPQDALFPAIFRGRWSVRAQVVEIKTPRGEENAPVEALRRARTATSLSYEARYLDANGGGGIILQNEGSGVSLGTRRYASRVIADRGFNAERYAAAQPGAAPLQDYTAKWDAGFPNTLTLTSPSGVAETKVIKRLIEEPYDGTFGTSEYARLTVAGPAGDLKAAPSVLAQRVQTKYKWEPPPSGSEEGVHTIEALELAVLASGFGDPAGATPLLVVKSRLTFTKR